ncbi:MAG TPA: class I SAM-dependent methyltransferase [Chloroflexia bacterium]|nr:class I SAM-dependent methyltransferase [Chloroflexia bacterium]
MHLQLPAILKCTYCGCEGLRLAENAELKVYNGEDSVESGAVHCPRCGCSYPIQDGIVNFIPVRPRSIGPAQWTNHFRLVAWGYERFWRKRALTALGGRPWPPEEELATVVEMLVTPHPAGLTIHNEMAFYLDQGCSTAFYGRAIARAIIGGKLATGSASGHVVGVDNSWPMLQEARGFIQRDGLTGKISLVRANVEKLPFIDAAFAGIASGGSLNEFRHTAKALAEARRTLSPQGRGALMVQMQARGKTGAGINHLLSLSSGLHFFERDQLNRYYQDAHFKVLEQIAEGLITITRLAPE